MGDTEGMKTLRDRVLQIFRTAELEAIYSTQTIALLSKANRPGPMGDDGRVRVLRILRELESEGVLSMTDKYGLYMWRYQGENMKPTLKFYKAELDQISCEDVEKLVEIERLNREIREEQEFDALLKARLDGAWA